jgi:hypothetical protein
MFLIEACNFPTTHVVTFAFKDLWYCVAVTACDIEVQLYLNKIPYVGIVGGYSIGQLARI